MLQTSDASLRTADPRCLEKREIPGLFLRLHSIREQIALPYSCLLKLTLSLDETALELSFVTHRVIISGKNLAEIYTAVAEAEARVISLVAPNFADEARLPSHRSLVRALRFEPLDAAEKRKQ
ncbi:MAG: hypothetical protein RLZZ15_3591 [Verrucomicrobiota bacterium]|jgi:hypothetical protein